MFQCPVKWYWRVLNHGNPRESRHFFVVYSQFTDCLPSSPSLNVRFTIHLSFTKKPTASPGGLTGCADPTLLGLWVSNEQEGFSGRSWWLVFGYSLRNDSWNIVDNHMGWFQTERVCNWILNTDKAQGIWASVALPILQWKTYFIYILLAREDYGVLQLRPIFIRALWNLKHDAKNVSAPRLPFG